MLPADLKVPVGTKRSPKPRSLLPRSLSSIPKTHIIFKAGKEEAIKTHKGFQSLNIAEIPSFQQHEANQKAISKVAYREDWDEEKGKKRFYAV